MTVEREKVFVCVDTDLAQHPRILACRDSAGCLGLWVAMTAYSRLHMLDGRVPKRYALSVWGDPRNPERLTDMVQQKLLVDHGEEYEILRYAPRNQTRAMVEKAKFESRKRMSDWRARQAAKDAARSAVAIDPGDALVTRNETRNEIHYEQGTNGSRDGYRSTSFSDLCSSEKDLQASSTEPGPPPVIGHRPRRDNASDDGCFGMAVSAWRDGVQLGLGAALTEPTARGEIQKLLAVLDAHAPPVGKPQEREAWAREAGQKFGEYCRENQESPNVFRFADWVDRKQPRERPSGVRKIQPPAPEGQSGWQSPEPLRAPGGSR